MKQIAKVELARCVALADLLDTVPAEDFNLRSWVSQQPRERETILCGLIEIHPGCGFAGCAMGWAAYGGIFPGFFVVTNGALVYERGRQPTLKNWEAVMALIGVNIKMAEWLFYPNGYKTRATPAMVADRLRRFASKIAAIRARDRRKAAQPVQRKLELVAA